jgi:hypothetical protein
MNEASTSRPKALPQKLNDDGAGKPPWLAQPPRAMHH